MVRRGHVKPRRRRWTLRLAQLASAVIAASILMVLPLRWIDPPVSAFMLQDDSGRQPLMHQWVAWEQLGQAPALAVVAAEDQKFADHFGFDFNSIRNSIEDVENDGRLRGASTISQQVAKNLYLWPGRSFLRKGIEAYLAIMIELCLPKQRVLEIYLNIAEFGPGIYGAGAASGHYFDKRPSQLSDREAALLAAVLPSPARLYVERPSPYVRERQHWILTHMQRLRREGWITQLK